MHTLFPLLSFTCPASTFLLRCHLPHTCAQALGSPLVSGDTNVSVLSGGGLRFKAMALKRRAPRLQMLFLVSGPQAHGVVSVEAKKKKVGGAQHWGGGENRRWRARLKPLAFLKGGNPHPDLVGG